MAPRTRHFLSLGLLAIALPWLLVFLALFFITPRVITQHLSENLAQAGYTLKTSSPTLHLLPTPSIRFTDVTLTSQNKAPLTASHLTLTFPWTALFSSAPMPTVITVEGASFSLDSSGKNDIFRLLTTFFANPSTPNTLRLIAPHLSLPESFGLPPVPLQVLTLNRLEDGLTLDGWTLHPYHFSFRASLDHLSLFKTTGSLLTLTAFSEDGEASFFGQANPGSPIDASGRFSFRTHDKRPSPNGNLLIFQNVSDPLALEGGLEWKGDKVSFSQGRLTLGTLEAFGNLELDFKGKKPLLSSHWSTPTLVLPGLSSPSFGSQAFDWSDQSVQIPSGSLGDAEITLEVTENLKVAAFDAGPSTLVAHLSKDRGKFQFKSTPKAHRDGKVEADFTAVSSPSPHIDGRFSLAHVDLAQGLSVFFTSPLLSGSVGGTATFHTQGRSLRQWVARLRGEGSFSLLSGALGGFDWRLLSQQLQKEKAVLWPQKIENRTSFSTISYNFTAQDGIISTPSLRAQTEEFDFLGEGETDFLSRRVDYRFIVSHKKGKDGEDPGLVEGPFQVKGPLPDVHIFQPDLDINKRVQ